ncbi:hypothetical protein GCM10022206_75080 [Streptomyces chiangmaiensis]
MTIALGVLATGSRLPGGADAHLPMVLVGFGLFNLFMNLGPNATTFALPAEVFPSEMRAAGHGFAAGCGKLGAALGTFLFPVLMEGIGQAALLYAVAAACACGFLITLAFRVEPRGCSLDGLSGVQATRLAPLVTPP